jgi:hypothetical protein
VLVYLVLLADRRRVLRSAAIVAAALLAVSGWWLVQNQVRYGGLLAGNATREHLRAILPSLFAVGSFGTQAFDVTPRIVFRSFWYTSGWNQLVWTSNAIYTVLWIGLTGGLAGLISRLPGRQRWAGVRGAGLVLWSMVVAGAIAVWTLGVETTTAQARVGFFAVPAVGVLYAVGTERMRLPVLVRFVLPVVGLALTTVALRRDVVAFFPS